MMMMMDVLTSADERDLRPKRVKGTERTDKPEIKAMVMMMMGGGGGGSLFRRW